MEKSKLISICKKLHSPEYDRKSPSEILKLFEKFIPFKMIGERMTAEDIILASFLLSLINKTNNVTKLYDIIKYNLFVFSFFEIVDDNAEVECQTCDGDGYISCEKCDTLRHHKCDCHDGLINCFDCDGMGYIETENSDIIQYSLVSYNQTLKNHIQYMDEFKVLNYKFVVEIFEDKKTIIFNSSSKYNVEVTWDEGSKNDFLFINMNEYPTFFKQGNLIDSPQIINVD